jgi:hypothetical protein
VIAARRLIKHVSFWLYCRRALPAFVVTWLFAAFNLRSL